MPSSSFIFISALNRLKQKRRLWFLLNDESWHILLSFLFQLWTGWNRNAVFGSCSMMSHDIFFFHFYFSFEQVVTETSSLAPAQWWVMTSSSFIFISALNRLKQKRRLWFLLNDESWPSSSLIFISVFNRLKQKRRLWFLVNDESWHLLLSFLFQLWTGWNRNVVFGSCSMMSHAIFFFHFNFSFEQVETETSSLVPAQWWVMISSSFSFLFKLWTDWNRNVVFGSCSMMSHDIFFFHFYSSFEQVETKTSSLVPAQWWVMTSSSFIFISSLNKLKQKRRLWILLNDESWHLLLSFLHQLWTSWNRNVAFGTCSMMSHDFFFLHFYFSF